MLPIERGIPIPSDADLERGAIKNTLLALSPGDSFVVDRKSIAAVYDNAKRLGVRVRGVLMPGKAKKRFWRLP